MNRFFRFLTAWLCCIALNVARPATIVIRGPAIAPAPAGGGLSFIQEAESAFNSAASKTTGSFTVQLGDTLVCVATGDDGAIGFTTPTNTGTSFTWTLQENVNAASYAEVSIWTATASAGQSMTVTVDDSVGTINWFGINVLTFRGSAGIGAAEQGNAASGDPSDAITTTAASSAIVMAVVDWNAVDGTTRAYNTASAGAFTELTYFRGSSNYTLYIGYYANAGSAGAKTVGITDPNGMKWSLASVEVK